MSDSAKDSPPSSASQSTVDPHRKGTNRPVGVSILAVVLGVLGLILFQLLINLFVNMSREDSASYAGRIPVWKLVANSIFLAALLLISGVGMWIGAKWGWWATAFYNVYSIALECEKLFMLASIAEKVDTHELVKYTAKYVACMIVHFLLLLYTFRRNVLEYFALKTVSEVKALGILAAISIIMIITMSPLSLWSCLRLP